MRCKPDLICRVSIKQGVVGEDLDVEVTAAIPDAICNAWLIYAPGDARQIDAIRKSWSWGSSSCYFREKVAYGAVSVSASPRPEIAAGQACHLDAAPGNHHPGHLVDRHGECIAADAVRIGLFVPLPRQANGQWSLLDEQQRRLYRLRGHQHVAEQL